VWQLTGTAPQKMDAPVFRALPDAAAAAGIALTGQWIWGPSAPAAKVKPDGENGLLRTEWKLAAEPVSGAAIVTGGDGFTLYLNGRRITGSDRGEHVAAIPLHDKLKAGSNQVVVIARHAGPGPAPGIYFQAEVRLADGTGSTLHSDAAWQFSPGGNAGREGRLGALPKNVQPAAVVAAAPARAQTLERQGPALLAQGRGPAGRMVRASLVKSDFLMRSLGRPNRDQIVSMRPEELTTLEALDLANGQTLTRALEQGAMRLAAQAWLDPDALITHLYLRTLARPPAPGERRAAAELLGPQPTAPAIADLLWALLMQPEFLYVH
jgi:hypothetical protein